MAKRKATDAGANQPDAELYALLDQLDRLEELLEEMDELGVATREEVERRLAGLHAEVDRLSPDDETG